MNKKIIISVLTLFAITLAGCGEVSNPDMDAFAQCLTDKSFTMYGTETCPHCKDQKEMFGDSVRLITYIGCDMDQQACADKNLTGVPAWDYPGGERLLGTQSLEILAEKSGCELPKEENPEV